MATINGREYVSVFADQIREGDTIHWGSGDVVVWGVEPSASSVLLYLGTTADHEEWESRGETCQWNSNPIWLSAWDAQIGNRDGKERKQ